MQALELSSKQGLAIGRAQELESFHKQAMAYYEDLGRAAAQQQRRSEEGAAAGAALLALGAGMLTENYQQQLATAMSCPRT